VGVILAVFFKAKLEKNSLYMSKCILENMDYDQYRGIGTEDLNLSLTKIWSEKVPFHRYCLVCQIFDNMDGF
jgi:hypothetical protein